MKDSDIPDRIIKEKYLMIYVDSPTQKAGRLIPAAHARRFRYRGFRLFAHKHYDIDGDGWRVSEYTTGHSIPRSYAGTRAESIRLAKREIDRVGEAGAKEAIARVIAERGKANA